MQGYVHQFEELAPRFVLLVLSTFEASMDSFLVVDLPTAANSCTVLFGNAAIYQYQGGYI